MCDRDVSYSDRERQEGGEYVLEYAWMAHTLMAAMCRFRVGVLRSCCEGGRMLHVEMR